MEQYANNPNTTLNGAINSTVTSLVVTDASLFPTTGNFRILIDLEILKVTAVSGTTFTVVRAQEGTTGNAHSNGVNVDQVLTKGTLDAIRGDDVTTDTWANRPTASFAGKIFLPNNSFQICYDNGSAWSSYAPIWPITDPPASGWTWYDNTSTNLFVATITTNGGIYINAPAVNNLSTNRAIYYRTYPTAPFTLTIGFLLNQSPRVDTSNVCRFGIGLLDASNHARTWDINNWLSSGRARLQLLSWTSHVQGGTGTGITTTSMSVQPSLVWMQFNDDNTNWNYRYSYDGINFKKWFTETRNTGVTPTRIGLFIGSDAENNSFNYGMNVFHWAGVA